MVEKILLRKMNIGVLICHIGQFKDKTEAQNVLS